MPLTSCTPWYVFEAPDTPGDWWDQTNTWAYNFRTNSLDQEEWVGLVNLVNSDYQEDPNGIPFCSRRNTPQAINLDDTIINRVVPESGPYTGSFYFPSLTPGSQFYQATLPINTTCPYQSTCFTNDFAYGPAGACGFSVAFNAVQCAEENGYTCNGMCISSLCTIRSMCNFPSYDEQTTCAYLVGLYWNFNGMKCSPPSAADVKDVLASANISKPLYQPGTNTWPALASWSK